MNVVERLNQYSDLIGIREFRRWASRSGVTHDLMKRAGVRIRTDPRACGSVTATEARRLARLELRLRTEHEWIVMWVAARAPLGVAVVREVVDCIDWWRSTQWLLRSGAVR